MFPLHSGKDQGIANCIPNFPHIVYTYLGSLMKCSLEWESNFRCQEQVIFQKLTPFHRRYPVHIIFNIFLAVNILYDVQINFRSSPMAMWKPLPTYFCSTLALTSFRCCYVAASLGLYGCDPQKKVLSGIFTGHTFYLRVQARARVGPVKEQAMQAARIDSKYPQNTWPLLLI